MNIVISGWPASGSTTLSLTLAYLLQYKYLYGGGVMKHLAQKIVGETSGDKYVQFENQFGLAWDQIWERYVAWKAEHEDGLLIEGKTTGFFLEDDNTYEVMLIAQPQVRMSRAQTDQRLDAGRVISLRDEQLRERWTKGLGIDIFNPRLISQNYDLVLDNSQMSVVEEIETVLAHLEEDYRFPSTDLSSIYAKIPQVVAEYQQHGKASFVKKLTDQGQLITPPQVFADWKEHFPDLVQTLPAEIKAVI